MKSNGGVIGAEVVRTQAIHTALSGPAAGVIGARQDRRGRRVRRSDLRRRRRHQRRRVPHPRRRGRGDRRGPHRQLAAARADDRHPHDRRRRRLDRARHRRRHPDGRARERGRRSRDRSCYGAGGEEPTVTDAHLVLGRIPAHLLRRRDRARRGRARGARSRNGWRGRSACAWRRPASGILDIVNNNMVGAHPAGLGRARATTRATSRWCPSAAPVRCTAPISPRSSACARSSSRATPACSRRSACSAPRCATTTRARICRSRPTTTSPPSPPCTPSSRARRRPGSPPRACPPPRRRVTRLADLRYRHQGFELTVPWPERDLAMDSAARALPRAPPPALHLRAGRRAGRDRHAARGRRRPRPALQHSLSLAPPRHDARRARLRRRVLLRRRRLEEPVPCIDARAPRRGRRGGGPGDRRAARRDDRGAARASGHASIAPATS